MANLTDTTVFENWLSATVFEGQELPFIDSSFVEAAMANVAAGKPAYVVTGYGNNIASAMLDSLNGKSTCGLEPSSRLSRLHTQIKAKKPAWLERYTWPQMLSWLTPVNDAGREALAWEISLQSTLKAAA
jgi:hypothetical protein